MASRHKAEGTRLAGTGLDLDADGERNLRAITGPHPWPAIEHGQLISQLRSDRPAPPTTKDSS